MTKLAKRSRNAYRKLRRNDRAMADGELEPDVVFAEVETFEELAPTLHALLLGLPSGTRVYVRVKRTVH